MNTPVKLPQIRKEAFVKARESMGLSTKDVSGMSCLSVRQIEQLESGESSSFYGAQVKVTAAKKVAALLKLKEEDAFDFGDIPQSPKSAIQEQAVPMKSDAPSAEKASIAEYILQPELLLNGKGGRIKATASIKNSKNGTGQKSQPPKDSKKQLFLIFAIGALTFFSVINLRPLFFPAPVKEEVVLIQDVTPEPPANAPAESSTDLKPATLVAAVIEPASAMTSNECPPADTSPIAYKPETAKKAGDMVYVQSQTAQTICVTDGSGRTQSKVLEPGVGVSIFGKPPLKVLTAGLNQLDLYYQGAKVRVGNTAGKTIVLESAEINQPAAPTVLVDSQLRQ